MELLKKYSFATLSILVILIFIFVTTYPDSNLHIITCDVGQGDATLIVHKNKQILIDGGLPHSGVISCLSENIPFWDRTLEMVVVTHPQLDHFGGIIEVFASYEVENILLSGLTSSTPQYQMLETIMGDSQVQTLFADDVPKVMVGLIQLDILHPKNLFAIESSERLIRKKNGKTLSKYETNGDPNDFSIVLKLSLNKFDAIFTGDISPDISNQIAENIAVNKRGGFEYIKVPHHGSKNGITKKLLDATKPSIAIISSGEKNRFGHPHKEILDLIESEGVAILRTDQLGEIEVVTDGKKYWLVE